jgi:hypothetical protein
VTVAKPRACAGSMDVAYSTAGTANAALPMPLPGGVWVQLDDGSYVMAPAEI